MPMMARAVFFALVLIGGDLTAGAADAPSRIRGTIAAVEGTIVHVAPNEGGDDILTMMPATRIMQVAPTTLDAITPGSFVGSAAKTQDDGTMVAVEVHVFPESMRGAGEGHRPFDLGPRSTMTNGTVGQEVVARDGQALTVSYKGGEKRIVVLPTTPIVALAPGYAGLLVKGAHVIVFAQKAADGTLQATSMLVGTDGFVPPM